MISAGVDIDHIECAADLPLPPRLRLPEPMFAILERPDGTRLRHARWTFSGRPAGTLLLLPGRSEFIEKYDEIAHEWLVRGWQVFALDWRSQGGSSRLLPNRQKGHIEDFALLCHDLEAWAEAVVAPRAEGPVVILAHSMGGHAALRWLARPGTKKVLPVDGLILSAPMTAIHLGLVPSVLARPLARAACRMGFSKAWAPGQGPYDPTTQFFKDNPVTSDRGRWALHHLWFRHNPDLSLGGVTWGWLDAAFRSMAANPLPPSDLPVLLLSAGKDCVVPSSSHVALARQLPRCRLVNLPGAMHEILMEADPLRAAAWAAIDTFVADVVKAPVPSAVRYKSS